MRRHAAGIALALVCSSGCAWAGSAERPAPRSDAEVRQATGHREASVSARADEVADSVGLNVHLHYTDTPYDNFEGKVLPSIRALGVRHLRDGVYTYNGISAESFFYQRVRTLASYGVKFDLITAMRTKGREPTRYSMLPSIVEWSDGSVESIEGANEPDRSGRSTWPRGARNGTRMIKAVLGADPGMSGVDVVAPAVTTTGAAASLGNISRWTDVGNVHYYTGERHPETAGWGPDGYGSVKWSMSRMAFPVSGDQPVMSTESGFSNFGGEGSIPEDVAAAYLPRMLLSNFSAGITRTYIYELLDQGRNRSDREDGFGLVRADGSRKPAFRALAAFNHLFADPGPAFSVRRLSVGVSAPSSSVRRFLVQRRDGSYLLAMWQPVSMWSLESRSRVRSDDVGVRVSPPPGYSVTQSSQFTRSGRLKLHDLGGTAATVDVGPRLTVVRIAPSR